MAVVRRKSIDNRLATVALTRNVAVTTAAAQLLTISSGISAITVYNQGTGSVLWGDSNVAVNSGTYLFPAAARSFDNLSGDFALYLRADSISSVISVTEFRI